MRPRPARRLRAALALTAAAATAAALLPGAPSTASPSAAPPAADRAAVVAARAADPGAPVARPTDSGSPLAYSTESVERACNAVACVHFATTGTDAPDLTDTTGNEVPDYVDLVLTVVGYLHSTYAGAGYRSPRPDGVLGGDAKLDVYLLDLGGADGLCATDQPESARGDSWAWCALDDDYARAQYPGGTPTDHLAVAATRYVFRAVQLAYDRYEDPWFLDATATWMEDEVLDRIDDNVRWLATSPLRRPLVPLDTSTGGHGRGAWSFIRFLSERYPAERGGIPRIVLDIVRNTDDAVGGRRMFSWQAINAALRTRGTTALRAFAEYAVANRRPATSYEEGEANRYPAAPLASRALLSPTSGSRGAFTLDHLTSATVRFTPRGLKDKDARLRVVYDLPPAVRENTVMLTKAMRTGEIMTRPVVLDKRGDATKVVPFDQRRVRWVELTFINASGRFRCPADRSGAYSCFGTSRDDDQVVRYRATALR